jgi:hypothetical protein
MRLELELAYEFVRQKIWDEYDFMGFIFDVKLQTLGKRRYK